MLFAISARHPDGPVPALTCSQPCSCVAGPVTQPPWAATLLLPGCPVWLLPLTGSTGKAPGTAGQCREAITALQRYGC